VALNLGDRGGAHTQNPNAEAFIEHTDGFCTTILLPGIQDFNYAALHPRTLNPEH
jgi:hypothetical protein